MTSPDSRDHHDRTDPHLPTMIGARLLAASVGLMLALAGGFLAAHLSAASPVAAAAVSHLSV